LLPESFLQEIKDRNAIETIISRYIRIKKGGAKMVGLCPFHNEKSPSFTVFEDTESFYCFGCGAGGDVITFIKRIENLDYVDAVKLLAEQSGLEVPTDDSSNVLSKLREKILQMNKIAAKHFHNNLYTEKGKMATQYIEKRGLLVNTVKHFGVGVALDEWDALLKELKQNGYYEEDIVSAGLAVKNEKGRCYDRFRNRLMFPIIDVRGNVIAFGGRVFDDSLPKYLNSPDTLVFKKSLNLFALNYAKNNNNNRLLLAEGYMDVISMHQAGFTDAIATLGTAITVEQARLMARYAKEVIIAYDSDGAGQKAAQKAIELLSNVGVAVKVLKITNGKDPDEYIKTYGAQRFKLLLEGSGNHIEYRIDNLRVKYDLDSPQDTINFLKEVAGVLITVRSDIEREVYINKVARETNIAKEKFEIEVNRRLRESGKRRMQNEFKEKDDTSRGVKDKVNPQKQDNIKAAKAEEGLISLLIQNPNFYEHMIDKITPEDFITDFNKKVFSYVCERIAKNLSLDFILLSKDFTNDEMSRITGIVAKGKDFLLNTKEEANSYIDTIKEEKHKPKLQDIKEMSLDDFRNSFKKR
jgi:DNA primase